LKAGIVFNGEFGDTEAGTPQGGVISPCLANLTLNGLGSLMEKKYAKEYAERKKSAIRYMQSYMLTISL
jgi:RNA-directed DNA polymerase